MITELYKIRKICKQRFHKNSFLNLNFFIFCLLSIKALNYRF